MAYSYCPCVLQLFVHTSMTRQKSRFNSYNQSQDILYETKLIFCYLHIHVCRANLCVFRNVMQRFCLYCFHVISVTPNKDNKKLCLYVCVLIFRSLAVDFSMLSVS